MIVENFNRPPAARIAETVLGRFKKRGTYGIMQVQSPKPLSNVESLREGLRKIQENHARVSAATQATFELLRSGKGQFKDMSRASVDGMVLTRVAWLHNRSDDYSGDVMRVYHILINAIGKPLPQKTEEDRYDALSYYSRLSTSDARIAVCYPL